MFQYVRKDLQKRKGIFVFWVIIFVLNPEKGVCADPGEGDATLGAGGPGPSMGDNERQLSLDRGGEKT